MDNPYSQIARVFTPPENGEKFRFGIITSVSPLEVDIGGPKVSGDKLFCNPDLLETEREAEVNLPTYDIREMDARLKVKEPLKAGDRVFCYTADDQVVYILIKVVSA